MTAAQLSKACFQMYEGADMGLKNKARELYELEYNLMKLYWLGMVSVKKNAEARLTYFYQWLIYQDLGKYL